MRKTPPKKSPAAGKGGNQKLDPSPPPSSPPPRFFNPHSSLIDRRTSTEPSPSTTQQRPWSKEPPYRPPNLVQVQVIIRPSSWFTVLEDQPSELPVLSIIFSAMRQYASDAEDPATANQLARYGINHCLASLTPTASLGQDGSLSSRDVEELDVDFSTATLAEVAGALGYKEPADYRASPVHTLTLRVSANGPSHVHRIALSYAASASTPRASLSAPAPSEGRGTPGTPASLRGSVAGTPPSVPTAAPSNGPRFSFSPLATATSPLPAPAPAPAPSATPTRTAASYFKPYTPPPAPSSSATPPSTSARLLPPPAVVDAPLPPTDTAPLPEYPDLDEEEVQPESPPAEPSRFGGESLGGSNHLVPVLAADSVAGPFELEANTSAKDVSMASPSEGHPSPLGVSGLSGRHGASGGREVPSPSSAAALHMSPVQPRVSRFDLGAARGTATPPSASRPPRRRSRSREFTPVTGGGRDTDPGSAPPYSMFSAEYAPELNGRDRVGSPDFHEATFTDAHAALSDLDTSGERTKAGPALFSWRGNLMSEAQTRAPSPVPLPPGPRDAPDPDLDRDTLGPLPALAPVPGPNAYAGAPLPPTDKATTLSHPLSSVPSRLPSASDMDTSLGVEQLVEQLQAAMGATDMAEGAGAVPGEEGATEGALTPTGARSLARLVAVVRAGDEDARLRALNALRQAVEDPGPSVAVQLAELQLPSLLVAHLRGPSDAVAVACFDLIPALAKAAGEQRTRMLSESGTLTFLLSSLTTDRGIASCNCLDQLCIDSNPVCVAVANLGGARVLSAYLDNPLAHRLSVVSILVSLSRAVPSIVADGPVPLQLVQLVSYQLEDEALSSLCLAALTAMVTSGGLGALTSLSCKEMLAALPDKVNGILLISPIALQTHAIELMLVLLVAQGREEVSKLWIDAFSASGTVRHLITPLRESDAALTLMIARSLLCFTKSTKSRQCKAPQLLSALAAAEKRAHETASSTVADEITHLVVAIWSTDLDS